MKKHLVSILKLVLSVGFGVLLIWLTFRGFSKSKPVTLPASVAEQTVYLEKWLNKPNSYYLVGDTIAYVKTVPVNGEKQLVGVPVVSQNEGTFSKANLTDNQALPNEIGSIKLDIWNVLLQTSKSANYFWIAFAMIVAVLGHLSRAMRWKMLLKPLGYNPKTSNTFFAVMVMYLGNLAFPRLGELLRCSILARYEKIPIQKGVGTMITERAVDVVGLLVVGVLTVATQYSVFVQYINDNILASSGPQPTGLFTVKNIAIAVIITLAIIAFLLYRSGKLPFADKIKGLVVGLWDGVKSIKDLENPWAFIGHTVFIYVTYWGLIYCSFFAVAETANLGPLVGLACLFFGAFGMIAVQGGLGVYPLIISQVLALYGISKGVGYSFGWIAWIGQTAMVIVVGFLAFVLLIMLNKEPEETKAASE